MDGPEEGGRRRGGRKSLLAWMDLLYREEAKHLDKKKGADKALVVKFYNDPQLRTLRMKHQRSSTVPLPAVFSKLPPSIGTISPPAANEVLLLGEGVKTFVLTLPDGSGYCRYDCNQMFTFKRVPSKHNICLSECVFKIVKYFLMEISVEHKTLIQTIFIVMGRTYVMILL